MNGSDLHFKMTKASSRWDPHSTSLHTLKSSLLGSHATLTYFISLPLIKGLDPHIIQNKCI